jgi:hypothetical protein
LFRVQTEGKEQLDAITRSVKGVSEEVRQSTQPLGQGTAALQRMSDAAARQEEIYQKLQRSRVKYDVGIGSLLDSARRATAETQRLNQATEKSIAQLERQAALAGKTGTARIEQLRKFAIADFGKSEEQVHRINVAYDAMGAALDKPVAATSRLAGLAGGALVSGLGLAAKAVVGLVAEYGKLAQDTDKLARSLGLTIGETEKWQAMARLAGTSTSALESGAARVAAALEDANGSGKKVVGVLRELRVSTRDLSGNQRDYTDVLNDAVSALARVEDKTKRYALAQTLLGRDGAREMQLLLEKYGEFEDEAQKLGAVLDENLHKRLKDAGDEIDRLAIAWDGFKKQLAAEIAPIVIPIVAAFTDALVGQRRPGLGASRTSGVALDMQALGQTVDSEADMRRTHQEFLQVPYPREAQDVWMAMVDARLEATFPSAPADKPPKPPRGPRDLTDQRNAQFGSLIDSLDQQGLDPLARLIAGTQTRLQDLVRKYGPLTGGETAAATTAFQGAFGRAGARIAPQSSMVDLNTTGFQYGALRTVAQQSTVDPRQNEAILAQFQERRVRALQQYTQFQEQVTRLTAGPGGELAAINQIAVLRLDAAEREFKITKDRARYEEQQDQARKERLVGILEFQRRQLEDYRQQAGQVYDALTMRGGGGFGDFLRGQGNILKRQLFVNASAGIFQRVGSTLGQVGAASGLGGLLKGTLFDPQNAQNAQSSTAANTTATERNTLALERNTAVAAGATIPGLTSGSTTGLLGALGIPGLTGSTGVGLPGGGLIQSATGSQVGGILSGLASPLTAGLFAGFRSGDYSIKTGSGTATSASAMGLTGTGARVANIGASGAIAGLGALGIYQGLQQGGARGTTNAIGSALGVAAMIPGPQQPFLQAGALMAGFISAMMPDPKKQRADEIGRTLERSRFADPVGVDRFTDQYGRDIDYNRRGEIRVMQPVTVNVSAMDSRSFLDRAEDIGNAVKHAIHGGHDVADAMRGLVFVH